MSGEEKRRIDENNDSWVWKKAGIISGEIKSILLIVLESSLLNFQKCVKGT